ncbi:hypothetical protein Q7P35_000334 [Cladosporium inversicolor]
MSVGVIERDETFDNVRGCFDDSGNDGPDNQGGPAPVGEWQYAVYCTGPSETSTSILRRSVRNTIPDPRGDTSYPPNEKGEWQCDEFPFKSTDPSRMMSKRIPSINRCVPARQNRLQGNILKQFYGSTGSNYKNGGGMQNQEGWFKLAFQGYAGISYCEDASTRDCTNDGNIHDVEGIAKIPDPLGVNLLIPAGADMGDVVRSHVFKDNGEEGSMELDEIVALANATRIDD